MAWRRDDVRIGTRSWGGSLSMEKPLAANFELGEVYWLEQRQPDFLRPEFRRRVRVTEKRFIFDHVVVGFVAVLPPPTHPEGG